MKISERVSGLRASAVVSTRTVKVTCDPERARRDTKFPTRAATTLAGSAPISTTSVSRASSDGWTTRVTHHELVRALLNVG